MTPQDFLELFLQQTITFFAILDPIGVSAIMLSLLHTNITTKQTKQVAKKVTLTIVFAFFVIFFAGNFLLVLFGININAVKIIGGIVLLLMSIKMIQGTAASKRNTDGDNHDDLAIVPIAIPILFGPGIFSTIIILAESNQTFVDNATTISAFLFNALFVYIIFRNSVHIKKVLSLTGQNIITKLMGLIVGAIAVQFIIGGIIQLIKIYS